MISLKTKSILTKFLLGLAKLEELAEKQRVQLCMINDFEPYSYFIQITNSEKMLQLDHLTQLTQNQIKFQGLIAVILAHDTTHCGYLDYNDFLRMTITNENLGLRQDVALRPKGIRQPSNSLITQCFVELLKFEAQGYMQLQEIKNELQSRYDFDVYDCFKCLDHKNKGFLDYDDLIQFVENSELTVHLIRRMNCNSGFKKVNYDHFQNIFKSQDNYLTQYSPEKLDQRRIENKSAQKMYQLYDSFLSNNTRLSTSPSRYYNQKLDVSTPNKKQVNNLQDCSTPIKKVSMYQNQSSFNTEPQSQGYQKTNKLTVPMINSKSPIKSPQSVQKQIQPSWTPVRKVNVNQPYQLKKHFDEKTDNSNSKVPLRFSPLQTIKNKTPKKMKTQSFFEQKQFNLPLEYMTAPQNLNQPRFQVNVRSWK